MGGCACLELGVSETFSLEVSGPRDRQVCANGKRRREGDVTVLEADIQIVKHPDVVQDCVVVRDGPTIRFPWVFCMWFYRVLNVVCVALVSHDGPRPECSAGIVVK